MYRECARELALRLLFIHYSRPSSYAWCEMPLPARKRANETRPFSRNATAPRNLARARRRYTCAGVCADPRARCSIALSCVRRDSLARAYALHRAAYRPARNYAAFAARARYERRRTSVCAWECETCVCDAPWLRSTVVALNSISRGRGLMKTKYIFFSQPLLVTLLKFACSSVLLFKSWIRKSFIYPRNLLIIVVKENCTVFSHSPIHVMVYFGRIFFSTAVRYGDIPDDVYYGLFATGSHSGVTRYMSSRAMVHSTVARTPRTQRGCIRCGMD